MYIFPATAKNEGFLSDSCSLACLNLKKSNLWPLEGDNSLKTEGISPACGCRQMKTLLKFRTLGLTYQVGNEGAGPASPQCRPR